MKIAIYARESSKDTEKAPSIDKQIQYCKEHSKLIIAPEYVIYKDNGWSGGSWNRPAWNQLMKDAKANRFKMVVVWNQDRIARDTEMFLKFYRVMSEKKIEIISVTDGKIDMETLGGRMKHGVLALADEAFRLKTSDKVREAYRHKKARGEPWGRKSALNEETKMMIRKLKADNLNWSPAKIRAVLGLAVSVSTVRRVLHE